MPLLRRKNASCALLCDFWQRVVFELHHGFGKNFYPVENWGSRKYPENGGFYEQNLPKYGFFFFHLTLEVFARIILLGGIIARILGGENQAIIVRRYHGSRVPESTREVPKYQAGKIFTEGMMTFKNDPLPVYFLCEMEKFRVLGGTESVTKNVQ